ncbi:MAG: restriction endonuclease subunit S, partial [Candidatus Bipolaricaulota bacterium]|nr:restriction endonuclease subunit S [Candidatus Bipolaricaulota bacterium]
WPTVRLGEVLTPVTREESVDAAREYPLLGVRLDGRGPFLRETVSGAETAAKHFSRVARGDFIYSRLFAWRGAFGVISEELDGAYVSDEFPTFAASPERLDSEFLRYWFRLPSTLERVTADCTGSTPLTRNRFKEHFFLALEISLPPLAEQQRIVARIEELAALIDEARALRQYAEEGADALLNATRHGIVARLGEAHCNVRLGDVCAKITDGPHVSPRYVEEGIPFISVRNISEDAIDFSSAKYVTEADHAEFSKKAPVEAGDVLYTKGGTTGIARRVDTDRPFSIWVHVALLKLAPDRAVAGFVEHMLNSPACKDQAEFFTHGSSNRDLGLIRMSEIRFPLPPLSEQRHIVAELDALQVEVAAAKRLQDETAAELDALLPSVLDRAFRGEL